MLAKALQYKNLSAVLHAARTIELLGEAARSAIPAMQKADARAKAILEERAQEFLQGTGESIGLPEVVPDINIELSDIGKPFSKTYYVSGAKHRIDSSGYRTTFNVQETTVSCKA